MRGVRLTVRYVLTTFLALVVGAVGVFPVFVLGLEVPMYVIAPLTLGTGGLLAALTAAWTGTLLSPDRTRTRLLRVVFVTECAVMAAILIGAALNLPQDTNWAVVAGMVVASLTAGWATWRFRTRRSGTMRDSLVTLILLAAAAFVVYIVVASLCSGPVRCVP